jgi:hypothetical protein
LEQLQHFLIKLRDYEGIYMLMRAISKTTSLRLEGLAALLSQHQDFESRIFTHDLFLVVADVQSLESWRDSKSAPPKLCMFAV